MKLTNREKILSIILVLMIIGLGMNHFVISPSIKKISNLKSELNRTINEVNILNIELSKDTKLISDYNILYENIADINENYYTRIIQENIIILIKEYLDNSNLEINRIDYFDPEISFVEDIEKKEANVSTFDELINLYRNRTDDNEETAEENVINTFKTSINIDFYGNYEELMSFLEFIENNKKRILISEINIQKSDGLLNGNMLLDLYTIPPLFEELENIEQWNIFNDYGKTNPFY